MRTTALSIFCALLGTAAFASGRLPAFPGAEGFGMYTAGGRGGYVYHVTSLEDTALTGTLRHALGQPGPRTVVFDVDGTIHLRSPLFVPDSTTIAGQTAPGDGICIAGYPVKLGSEVILRYVRFRLGADNVTDKNSNTFDALGASGCHNIIVDHCSVSWSIDECCSIYGNYNTTLQWSIVSQSLVNAGHHKGNHGYGGIWGGAGASFHHNLIVHHTSRTPRLGPHGLTQLEEHTDMRNNVIYNYGGNGCYGCEAMDVNIVNNYYKPGPGSHRDSRGARIAQIGIRTEDYCSRARQFRPVLHRWGHFYVDGNVNTGHPEVKADNWAFGIYNQIDTTVRATDGTWNDSIRRSLRLERPIAFPATTTHSAEMAYERVLDYAGASLRRDALDSVMVADTRSGSATYTSDGLAPGFINSPHDLIDTARSPFPVLRRGTPPTDTDRDGMPDVWELKHGLDPTNPSDRNTVGLGGYTMLEIYLAEIVKDITEAQNSGGETCYEQKCAIKE